MIRGKLDPIDVFRFRNDDNSNELLQLSKVEAGHILTALLRSVEFLKVQEEESLESAVTYELGASVARLRGEIKKDGDVKYLVLRIIA